MIEVINTNFTTIIRLNGLTTSAFTAKIMPESWQMTITTAEGFNYTYNNRLETHEYERFREATTNSEKAVFDIILSHLDSDDDDRFVTLYNSQHQKLNPLINEIARVLCYYVANCK